MRGNGRRDKDVAYWSERMDVFYQSPAAIKAKKQKDEEKLKFKDTNLDADD